MAGLRFQVDLFIKEDPDGVLVGGVKIPAALASLVPDIRQAITRLKSFATRLDGENTLNATYHKCFHDENPPSPCGSRNDI